MFEVKLLRIVSVAVALTVAPCSAAGAETVDPKEAAAAQKDIEKYGITREAIIDWAQTFLNALDRKDSVALLQMFSEVILDDDLDSGIVISNSPSEYLDKLKAAWEGEKSAVSVVIRETLEYLVVHLSAGAQVDATVLYDFSFTMESGAAFLSKSLLRLKIEYSAEHPAGSIILIGLKLLSLRPAGSS